MTTSHNQPSPASQFRTVDAARGILITVVTGFVGYFAIAPAPTPGRGGFWITHTGLLMLLIGIALQLAIIFGRPLLARFEQTQDMEGQLSPVVIHFLQLLADGATVLLLALAVFGGIGSIESDV